MDFGDRVTRGQRIATVGDSGHAQGTHNHFWVAIAQLSGGVLRLNYHDPTLFLPGGSKAGSPLIASRQQAERRVRLNGAGINIRSAPSLTLDAVFATSTPQGILRRGAVIAPLDKRMVFIGWANGDGLVWAKVRLNGWHRFISKQLIHFVV